MAETPPGLENLKLWMKLNDNAATSAVINEVGDNGTLYGQGEPPEEKPTNLSHISSGNPPYLNGALHLGISDGGEDVINEIRVPHSADITFTSEDFSIAMWVNVETAVAYDYFIAKGMWGEDGWGVQQLADRQLHFFTNQAAAAQQTLTATNAWTDGAWWFLVITRDGAVAKIYKDAVDITDTSGSHIDPTADTDPLTIGANSEDADSRGLDGKLDNIMIFNKVLTQNEINWLYNSGNGRENPFMPRPLVGGSLAGNSLVGKGLAR